MMRSGSGAAISLPGALAAVYNQFAGLFGVLLATVLQGTFAAVLGHLHGLSGLHLAGKDGGQQDQTVG
ncbi:MAG: hypothetical protein ACI9EB_002051 [Pseudomonas sp.]|jgi:hypothetical protein